MSSLTFWCAVSTVVLVSICDAPRVMLVVRMECGVAFEPQLQRRGVCAAKQTEPEEWDNAAGAARFRELVQAFKRKHAKFAPPGSRDAVVAAHMMWCDGGRVCDDRAVDVILTTLVNLGTDSRSSMAAKVSAWSRAVSESMSSLHRGCALLCGRHALVCRWWWRTFPSANPNERIALWNELRRRAELAERADDHNSDDFMDAEALDAPLRVKFRALQRTMVAPQLWLRGLDPPPLALSAMMTVTVQATSMSARSAWRWCRRPSCSRSTRRMGRVAAQQ